MKRMPFILHLKEMRSRLISCIIVFLFFFALCWWQYDMLWHWLTTPLCHVLPQGHRLIFTGLSEAFMTYIKVSALAALGLSWPVWAWHVWRFVAPGLVKSERLVTVFVLLSSTLLFVIGAIFAYGYVCPAAYEFFLSFERPNAAIPLQLDMRISEYIGFTLRVMVAFGLCGQLPLVMVLLTKWGFVSSSQWLRLSRPVCAGIFAVSAVITPPDILSMLALAVPLCLIYACTLLFLMWLNQWNKPVNPPKITTTDGPTGQS